MIVALGPLNLMVVKYQVLGSCSHVCTTNVLPDRQQAHLRPVSEAGWLGNLYLKSELLHTIDSTLRCGDGVI